MDTPAPTTFLVFGDLHGRVLPAFRFASYWSRRTKRRLDGLLQVGDMGYFPNPATMDKATIRHAKDDPLELGTFDIVQTNPLAKAVFEDDPHCPPGLWFTAGNHEDFKELERLADASGKQPDFVADAYCRVRGIKDGQVKSLPERSTWVIEPPPELLAQAAAKPLPELRVGAIWGVDGDGPNGRKNLPPRGYIDHRAVDRLAWEEFDVLLSHDAPKDAKRVGYGSEALRALIGVAKPKYAFFGHYGGDGSWVDGEPGETQIYHLAGFELRTREGHPETGSVGVLEQTADGWSFDFIADEDMNPFTRHNWKWV
ncbi:MAG: metallophosphoesterase [Planctomycetes bacterium]|nr:metallophosphoesterase [Planctomycetota bacterium]